MIRNTILIVILLSVLIPDLSARDMDYDVVVYGATASGTVAAIAAANEGSEVLLIEQGSNVGGMVTGGLSHNDYGDRTVIGGMALEFYKKVADYYGKPLYYWRGPEPHVGEKIFREWLQEAGVNLLFENRVAEVDKQDGKITRIKLTDGSIVTGKVFIDASYEGDLMARAGVTYTIGRESIKKYNESWAGRRAILPDGHQMLPRVSPFRDETSREILPLINQAPLVGEGEADKAVQGYGFRVIATTDPGNSVPFPKPVHYDPDNYLLISRYYEKHPDAGNMVHLWPTLPHGKSDMNSSGPISTNVVDGLNWEYPDASYERRDEIWQLMKEYTLGLIYFLSNDQSVPERIRKETGKMALCRDEFADNEHWPHQLYIRVGRRMVGEYVMTQADLEKDTVKYDAIGMGSYNIDVRHVQRTWIPVSRFPELHYEVYNEGYISIPVAPYEIPFRALLPKYDESTNLIVPVCISASHIAYASVRMEPQYMVMGQAAGVAAALAARDAIPVHKVDIIELQGILTRQNQVLTLKHNVYGAFDIDDGIIIDNNMKRFTEKRGSWQVSETEHNGRYQMNYAENRVQQGTFSFCPWIPESGNYEISIWNPVMKSSGKSVPVEIETSGGVVRKTVNQHKYGEQWVSLGTYELEKGTRKTVTIIADQVEGTVVADAVKFKRVD
ncbi:MAG: FAD-dependent oxidoreductase [Bacteroidales bacterium]